MATTIAFTRSSQVSGSDVPPLTFSKTFSLSASSWAKVQESLIIGTDTLVNIAIDVSEVVFFRIHSTTAATIQTNDGTSPDDTLSLLADVAYEWHTTDYNPFLLTADVTKLYVTNAAATVLTVEVLQDATP
jgi:hypothetical protein